MSWRQRERHKQLRKRNRLPIKVRLVVNAEALTKPTEPITLYPGKLLEMTKKRRRLLNKIGKRGGK